MWMGQKEEFVNRKRETLNGHGRTSAYMRGGDQHMSICIQLSIRESVILESYANRDATIEAVASSSSSSQVDHKLRDHCTGLFSFRTPLANSMADGWRWIPRLIVT